MNFFANSFRKFYDKILDFFEFLFKKRLLGVIFVLILGAIVAFLAFGNNIFVHKQSDVQIREYLEVQKTQDNSEIVSKLIDESADVNDIAGHWWVKDEEKIAESIHQSTVFFYISAGIAIVLLVVLIATNTHVLEILALMGILGVFFVMHPGYSRGIHNFVALNLQKKDINELVYEVKCQIVGGTKLNLHESGAINIDTIQCKMPDNTYVSYYVDSTNRLHYAITKHFWNFLIDKQVRLKINQNFIVDLKVEE